VAEKTEASVEPVPAAASDSKHVGVKSWSVIARFLHEGTGIVLLQKVWDQQIREFLLVPWYADQDPDRLKPDVWTAWRHELKAPLGGHAYIRDVARVVDVVPIQSKGALDIVDPEVGQTLAEAGRLYEMGKPGLKALILRVYHLPRSYKYYNLASLADQGEVVPISFEVALADLTPSVEAGDFERRRSRILKSLGRA
jgi:hypothetical protein